ncbi:MULTISPECIES: hypothetical protein [unclassified Mameliella]|uniref:hypothetical protein n=1 Tax=unclassified Mameliella TaxID=2630630 RepID=UPI00273FBFB0|nr:MULTISPECIES: hypothetical protein [unclassified Mameliella]
MTERKDNRDDPVLPKGRQEDDALGLFFAAARAETPQPGGDFLARIEAQALAEQPRVSSPAPVVLPRRPERLAQLREALGGWIGVTGLATACAAGILIGVSSQDSLSVFWGGDAAGLGTLGVDPLSGFDLALMEG